jgi:single-strand DNA-binding protein
MASLNRVFLMGNLTRDPQMRYLPSQTAVAEFGLACNRKWRTPQGEEKEEVLFVDCTAFGKTAETVNQYFTKGKPIFIEGRLKYDTWEDKNGGGKRSKLTVVIDNFQFIGGRDGAGPGGGGGGYSGGEEGDQSAPPRRSGPPAQQPQQRRPAPQQQQQPPISEEEHFKEDDIPF